MIRGGSWGNNARNARAANRNNNNPVNRNNNIGFRPVSSRRWPEAPRSRTRCQRPGCDPLSRTRAGQSGRTKRQVPRRTGSA